MSKIVRIIKNSYVVNAIRNIKLRKERKLHQEKKEQYGYEIINIIDEIGNKCHIDIWIEWGTLLGLVREGQLIGHDYDVDFATYKLQDDQYRKLTMMLKEQGFILTRQFIYQGAVVSETYEYKDTLVDIDYCITDDREIVFLEYDIGVKTIINKEAGRYNYEQMDVMKYHVPRFELKRAAFTNGASCNIPSNAEEHIELLYGKDWRTPNPDFDYKSLKNFEIFEADVECMGWRRI